MADPPPAPKVFQPVIPKAAPGSYNSIAAQYARAKAAKEKEDERKVGGIMASFGLGGGEVGAADGRGATGSDGKGRGAFERLNQAKEERFREEWAWVLGFWVWLL
jgi:phosphatidylinositol glycan class O